MVALVDVRWSGHPLDYTHLRRHSATNKGNQWQCILLPLSAISLSFTSSLTPSSIIVSIAPKWDWLAMAHWVAMCLPPEQTQTQTEHSFGTVKKISSTCLAAKCVLASSCPSFILSFICSIRSLPHCVCVVSVRSAKAVPSKEAPLSPSHSLTVSSATDRAQLPKQERRRESDRWGCCYCPHPWRRLNPLWNAVYWTVASQITLVTSFAYLWLF